MRFSILFLFFLFGLLLGNSVSAITLQDILNQPLPDVGAFMVRVWDFLVWLWGRIVYYAEIILNWTLDNVLSYIWRILVWMWNTLVAAIIAGWQGFLYFWHLLTDNSFLDFGDISWPWD